MYLIIIILILILFFTHLYMNHRTSNIDNVIKTLVRQASRWSIASEQDESPLIALLHANYGAGYLWALKDISTDSQIKSTTGIDTKTFEKRITSIQDKATKRVSQICPQFIGEVNPYLANIAGNI